MFWLSSLLAVASTPACLQSADMAPGFFAVSAPYGKDVTPWYMETFSARLVKRNEAKEGSGYADILQSGPLVIELIYHPQPLDRREIAPDSRQIQWSGIVKAGPAANADLKVVSNCFQDRGLNTVWLVTDAETAMEYLRIEDPNGTPIDIVAPAPPVQENYGQAETKETSSKFSPRLSAVSVSDVVRSFEWYRDVLGFQELARHEFPDEGLIILFAVRDGFELELIEKAGSAPFDSPDPANPASRRGVGKLAFTVSDLGNWEERAEAAGAEFVNPVRRSNRTGGCHMILADPDGNWIQLFGACPGQSESDTFEY